MDQQPTCYRHPDRETGLSCTDCGRPICTDCATFAPVGIRCPEHAAVGAPRGELKRTVRQARTLPRSAAFVTKTLIGLNVGIYLVQLALGAPLSAGAGRIFEEGALYGPLVAHGDWWRLITAAFLHLGPFHLLMNMLVLWWFGGIVEEALGALRYLLVYLASGLAGSAGALLLSPDKVTVGASGAVFGILGAGLVLEWLHTRRVVGGPFFSIIVLNLIVTFALSRNISVGGHLGGLIGGALSVLALSRFGLGHAVYGRTAARVIGIAGVLAVAVLSVAVAYWKVRGLV